MGDTRSIRVFVMGEAQSPGQLHGQRARDHHLGAVRRRAASSPSARCATSSSSAQGAVVRRLDLYDLLLRGDTSDDAKLLPGDVIFIPPVVRDRGRRRRSASAGDLRAQGRRPASRTSSSSPAA